MINPSTFQVSVHLLLLPCFVVYPGVTRRIHPIAGCARTEKDETHKFGMAVEVIGWELDWLVG